VNLLYTEFTVRRGHNLNVSGAPFRLSCAKQWKSFSVLKKMLFAQKNLFSIKSQKC